MTVKSLAIVTALVGATVGGLAWSAAAQEKEATGVIAYRQAVMGSLGANTGALKSLLTDTNELAANLETHAAYIASIGDMIPAMFPEGSFDPETSDALETIWEDQEDFKSHAENMSTLATELADAASGGAAPDELLPMFAKLGKEGCGGCHDDYRKKDE